MKKACFNQWIRTGIIFIDLDVGYTQPGHVKKTTRSSVCLMVSYFIDFIQKFFTVIIVTSYIDVHHSCIFIFDEYN